MKIARRGFLGTLLAIPALARLTFKAKPKPEPIAYRIDRQAECAACGKAVLIDATPRAGRPDSSGLFPGPKDGPFPGAEGMYDLRDGSRGFLYDSSPAVDPYRPSDPRDDGIPVARVIGRCYGNKAGIPHFRRYVCSLACKGTLDRRERANLTGVVANLRDFA